MQLTGMREQEKGGGMNKGEKTKWDSKQEAQSKHLSSPKRLPILLLLFLCV